MNKNFSKTFVERLNRKCFEGFYIRRYNELLNIASVYCSGDADKAVDVVARAAVKAVKIYDYHRTEPENMQLFRICMRNLVLDDKKNDAMKNGVIL